MIATATITLFNSSTSYNLTSRTYGATCSTECQPGVFGRAYAAFDFNNNDGAMTPGGGGTFSAVDWFAMGIEITYSTSEGSGTSFVGIITDFQLVDDGRNSYVRLTAVDAFTIGGSTATTVDTGATLVAGTVTYWINSFFNGNSTYITSVGMPKLGALNAAASSTDVGLSGSVGLGTKNYLATGRASDFVNNSIMPAGPNFAWPTDISTGGTTVTYNYNAANIYPLRSSPTVAFTFAENPVAGELPILDLVRKFNTDDLLNNSSVTTLPIPHDSSTFTDTELNATSQGLYGTRTISMTAMMAGAVTGANSQAPGTANTSAGTVAQRWANTYSDVDFVTMSLVVTDSSLTGNGLTGASSVTAYGNLLDASTALLQLALVQYTPTGAGSEQTDTLITIGRDIQFTTSDIRIKVKFMVADRSGLILDNSQLGVLDQNRLG